VLPVQADLEEKIRRLEEDKNNVDFSTGLWEQSTRRAKKRKLDPGDPDRSGQPIYRNAVLLIRNCELGTDPDPSHKYRL